MVQVPGTDSARSAEQGTRTLARALVNGEIDHDAFHRVLRLREDGSEPAARDVGPSGAGRQGDPPGASHTGERMNEAIRRAFGRGDW